MAERGSEARAEEAERELQILRESEEALRSTQAEFDAFREQVLQPIRKRHADIESLSWDELLGVAVRNLNEALEAEQALREVRIQAKHLGDTNAARAIIHIVDAALPEPAPGGEDG
jgi:arginine utilization protein RocB